jgi:transcriptional regulator with XRE-family HTH domain
MPRQADLAKAARLHQSRISMFETPGAANMTIETLARLAAAFKVGLVVKFVPFSEMLAWENHFSQDSFNVVKIDVDQDFLNPILQPAGGIENRAMRHNDAQMVPVRSAGSAGLNDSPFLALGKISTPEKQCAGVAA